MDTKALRQKILDLAIRGKLVPQDPADEPASVLLERIRAEKQQMVKDGKLKAKDIKNDTVIYVGEDNLHYEKFSDGTVKCIEDEIPFEIPNGWAWARLLSIIEEKPTNGYSPKGVEYITDVRNLTLTATTSGFFKPNEFKYVDVKIALDSKYWLRHNDILIQRSNSRELVGTSCIYDDKDAAFIFPDLMMKIHLMSGVEVKYIDWVLKSTLTREYYIANATGSASSMPKINQAIVANTLIPLPPCAEQKRLVRYLDEVMNISNCIETGRRDILELVSQAKAKILDLAIRGKLVPQDPADEPASVLLERIRADKEEQIKAGKIKRDKKESFIFRGEDNSYYEKIGDEVHCIDSEIPYTIPSTWTWCRGWSCFKEQESVTPPAGSFLYIDIDSIDNTRHVISRPKTLAGSDAPSRARRRIQTGSVVFSLVRPYLENIALVSDAHSGGIASTGFYVCTSEGMMIPSYMFLLMTSRYVVHGLNQFMKGDNSPSISKNDIEQWLYPIPPISEQQKISIAVDHFFELIQTIEQSLN